MNKTLPSLRMLPLLAFASLVETKLHISPSFMPSADMMRATVVLVSVGVPPEERYVLLVIVITFRRVFTSSPARSSVAGVVSSVDTTVFSTGSSSFIFLLSVVLYVW